MFSKCNRIKLETNNRRKFGKFTNMCKLNTIVLSSQWIREEITNKVRKYIEMDENKNITHKTMRCHENNC